MATGGGAAEEDADMSAAEKEAAEGSDYELDRGDDCYADEHPGPYRTVEGPTRLAGTRMMTSNFECEGHGYTGEAGAWFGSGTERAPHGKRASAAQPREATVMMTRMTHQSIYGPDERSERETLLCSKCAEMRQAERREAEESSRELGAQQAQEAEDRRAFTKRKADDRAAERQKRLRTLEDAGGDTATLAARLRELKGPELKRLCVANQLMVSTSNPPFFV